MSIDVSSLHSEVDEAVGHLEELVFSVLSRNSLTNPEDPSAKMRNDADLLASKVDVDAIVSNVERLLRVCLTLREVSMLTSRPPLLQKHRFAEEAEKFVGVLRDIRSRIGSRIRELESNMTNP